MRNRVTAGLVAAGFLTTILVANYVTSNIGLVPVGFGLMATAGTYLIGLSFILRDALQDLAGRVAVFGLILAGTALSFTISAPGIALASAAAFLLSETADLLVYTPLRDRSYGLAALASNVVGALADTAVFLWLAAPALRKVIPGFQPWDAAPGQVAGKLLVTLVFVAPFLVIRAAVRRPAASEV